MRGLDAFGVDQLVTAITGLPQTQRDINVLANTAEQFQSPQVQAQLSDLKTSAEVYMAASLALTAIIAFSAVGNFLISYQKHDRRR